MFSNRLTCDTHSSSPIKEDEYQVLKKWIISTYGEGSKSKTVCWNKYLRIHRVLTGRCPGESPKFKFWVKTKGFRFLPCVTLSGRPSEMAGYVIGIPNKKTSADGAYRRVAVVEEFFDIIYDIHVNIDGRNGKHAGQKRTYRAIMESYAFLPREAVTHFLMCCKQCRERMHLTMNVPTAVYDSVQELTHPDYCSSPTSSDLSIDVESESTYEDSMSAAVEATQCIKEPAEPSDGKRPKADVSCNDDKDVPQKITDGDTPEALEMSNSAVNDGDMKDVKEETVAESKTSNGVVITPGVPSLSNALKRPAPVNLSPTTSKKSSDEADDDDEEEDDDEKLSTTGNDIDPERLKAFNMFCRLFVDENLDRLVPISKQPKDKVQAILDACNRQFPEFHDRSRKRIRTYLKSCRRMRRAREMNGWDNIRPTPPHLTSPVAESLLSQACENESQNAKRMRMGLEPISASSPAKLSSAYLNSNAPNLQKTQTSTATAAAATVTMPSLVPASLSQANAQPAHRLFPDWRFQQVPPFRPDMAPFFSNGFFRPPFPGFHPPLPTAAALQASQTATQLALQHSQGTAANLAIKKSTPSTSTPIKGSSLTATEMATIRQLISGYRESATFLYRSADELEQLIATHND